MTLSSALARSRSARQFFIERLRFPLVVFFVSFALFLVVRTYARASGKYPLLLWDADWYGQIISSGYFTDGNTSVGHNVVYLPLYPLACMALKRILSIATPDAMLLVSALSTMVMLVLLYNFLAPLYSAFVTRLTILFLALGPFSLFLYNGYSEALFLCLLALFFVLLLRGQYLAAGIVTGIASACRPYAPMLVLVLIFEAARRYYAANRLTLNLRFAPLRDLFLAIPLSFSGLVAYTLYTYRRFDDPLAFAHGYAAWSSHGAIPSGLGDIFAFHYVMDGIGKYAYALGLLSPMVVGLVLFASGPLLLLAWRRELLAPAAVYLGLMFLFYHFNVIKDQLEITNLGRHFSLLFPYPLLLALALDPARIRRVLLRSGPSREHERYSCHCIDVLSWAPSLLLLIAFLLLDIYYVVLFYNNTYVS